MNYVRLGIADEDHKYPFLRALKFLKIRNRRWECRPLKFFKN